MIIDVHCHYSLSARRASAPRVFSFEPGDAHGDTPDAYDACVSPRAIGSLKWRVLHRIMRLRAPRERGEVLDAEVEQFTHRHLLDSRSVDRFVLLAFDAYHDDAGRRPPLPHARRERGSDLYTSNTLIVEMVKRHPDRFLFGASVHPYRADALRCLDEVVAAGACLLKWLPLHHNINVEDPRSVAALRHCARLGLPVLVHCGEEFTLATNHPEQLSVRPLLRVLSQLRREVAMPATIVAHVSTPVFPWGERDSMRCLVDALTGEFADAPLYADISALGTIGKTGFLQYFARRQDLHHKLLFGTDFPVPVSLARLRGALGRQRAEIASIRPWPERFLRTCRHLGFNEIVFHRAATILPIRSAGPRARP